jgi:hypothetical protein
MTNRRLMMKIDKLTKSSGKTLDVQLQQDLRSVISSHKESTELNDFPKNVLGATGINNIHRYLHSKCKSNKLFGGTHSSFDGV